MSYLHLRLLFKNPRHLASRVQLGSSITMKLLNLPPTVSAGLYTPFLSSEQIYVRSLTPDLFSDERDRKLVCEQKPLVWEEDIELYSKFLDRKVVFMIINKYIIQVIEQKLE